jgi:hypothetical protein
LQDYRSCEGTLTEHCDVACIRTPGPECQRQCREYSKAFIPPQELPWTPYDPGQPGRSPPRPRRQLGRF